MIANIKNRKHSKKISLLGRGSGLARQEEASRLCSTAVVVVALSLSSLYSNCFANASWEIIVCCWLPFFVVAQAGLGVRTGNFASS